MNHDDQLHDIFSRQASRAPDPLALQGKVHEALDRRRRRQQAAAVLSASLAVTGLALGVRALAPSHQAAPERLATPPSATSTPTPASSPSPGALGEVPALQTYFDTGYGYDDALVLSTLWKGDAYTCKAVAGQAIQDGRALPIRPGQGLAQATATSISIPANQAAFTNAGYTDADAIALAGLWNTDADVARISAVAGQLLRDGRQLPLP